MSIELTIDQHLALEGEMESPPRVIDRVSNTTYVLIRTEVYERLQGLLDDDVRRMAPLLAELAPEDWEDLATYENRP